MASDETRSRSGSLFNMIVSIAECLLRLGTNESRVGRDHIAPVAVMDGGVEVNFLHKADRRQPLRPVSGTLSEHLAEYSDGAEACRVKTGRCLGGS